MSEPGVTGSQDPRLIALYSWNQALANFLDANNTASAGSIWLEEMHWLVETDTADSKPTSYRGLRAFISPTIGHFSTVLALAGFMLVPGHTKMSLSCGFGLVEIGRA